MVFHTSSNESLFSIRACYGTIQRIIASYVSFGHSLYSFDLS